MIYQRETYEHMMRIKLKAMESLNDPSEAVRTAALIAVDAYDRELSRIIPEDLK